MPPQTDYVAWVAPAVAIAGSGNKLLFWRGSEKNAQWSELVDFTRYGLRHISRLALSPDHAWLAIVAEPAK
jgi:hypothetical protein